MLASPESRRRRVSRLVRAVVVAGACALAISFGPLAPALASEHFHGEGCGHFFFDEAWHDFPRDHRHDADCGHFEYAGGWHLFAQDHAHGSGCGHFYWNGRWDYFPSSHRHDGTCGHHFHGGVWQLFPRAHRHEPGCGHFYWASCWQVVPQDHRHTGDCGHVFAAGDWRPATAAAGLQAAGAFGASEGDVPTTVIGGDAGAEGDDGGAALARRRFPRPAPPTAIDAAEAVDPASCLPPSLAGAFGPDAPEQEIGPAGAGGYFATGVPPVTPLGIEAGIGYARVAIPHVHGAGCGHLFVEGGWRSTGRPAFHEHGPGCGHALAGVTFRVVAPPPPHVHGRGCGHIYFESRWHTSGRPNPPAIIIRHGAGCGCAFCGGHNRSIAPESRSSWPPPRTRRGPSGYR